MSDITTNADNTENVQNEQDQGQENIIPENTQNIEANTTEAANTPPATLSPEATETILKEEGNQTVVTPESSTPSEEASANDNSESTNMDIADKAEMGVTAEATAKMEEALKAEPTAEELAAREEAEKLEAAKKEENKKLYEEYKAKKGSDETITVSVIAKVRGGLRVEKDGFQMFLPAALVSSSRTEDEELEKMVGQNVKVQVSDADDERESIVVSRKAIAEKEAWENIKVGEVVKGKVTSVPTFGVFLDVGGVEGLLHVSRISHKRVEDPSSMFKKGDELEVKIIEVNQSKGKISLSRKELEDSPWKNASSEFTEGSTHSGKVKNITNFGMYVEMKPGVEGLVRMNELSWTRRGRIEDMYKAGDEVEFYVMNVNEDKGQADLSIKRLTTDPWEDVAEKYTVGETYKGSVKEIVEKGVRFNVNNEVDAFMPKSRMRPILKNGTIPYDLNQEVEVVVIDLDASKQSMILAPKVEGKSYDSDNFGGGDRPGRGDRGGRKGEPIPKEHDGKNAGSFSLGDMLGNLLTNKEDEK